MGAFHDFEHVFKNFLLNLIADTCETVHFLEIGANDGLTNGMIYPFLQGGGWKGGFVEPVPYLFERLKGNISGFKNVVALPYACGPERGQLTFYSVAPPKSDRAKYGWIELIGSFDREVVMLHRSGFPALEDHIRELKVETYTATDLVQSAKLNRLDVMIVDAEGFDDKVVYSLDLSRYRPKLICIEHRHIHGERREKLNAYCKSAGFEVWVLNWDTVFIAPDVLSDTERNFLRKLTETLAVYAEP